MTTTAMTAVTSVTVSALKLRTFVSLIKLLFVSRLLRGLNIETIFIFDRERVGMRRDDTDDTDAVAFDNIDRIPTNEISNERDKKEKTVFCRVKSFNRGISRRMKVLESLRY